MPDIKNLTGIAAAREKMFNQLDISTVSDLLHYYPRTYQDRRQNTPLSDFKTIQDISILATVISAQLIPARFLQIFKVFLQTEDKQIYEAVWFKKRTFSYDAFGQIKKDFKTGSKIWVIGKREDKNSFASRKIVVDEYYLADSPEAKIQDRKSVV